MNFDEVDKIINMAKETDDMSEDEFIATLGTVMKIYSVKHDIPMKDIIIKFAVCMLDTENSIDG